MSNQGELRQSRIPMYRNALQYPEFKNVVFLDRVGETLRQATTDIALDDLPENILLLLRRLERIEQRDRRRAAPDK